ncbi:hypothetical protein BJY04DRAFT_213259 [Aspergillus karnatakaensis]|uniref:Zn(II)2Cys6 transcription factor n=1 Tax=Aspergillus karnatakaensis TaxID=1810916 RepID=UPI003CCE4006
MTEYSETPKRKRPAPRGTAFYPRKRANTACQVCRSRKTKCDNRKPSCSYCLSVGAVCIQSTTDLSSFDPASLKILERLDELEHVVRQRHQETRSASAVVSLPPDNEPVSLPQASQPAPSLAPLGSGRRLSVAAESPEKLLRLPVFGGFRSLPTEPLIEGRPSKGISDHPERQTLFAGLDTTLPGGVNGLVDSFFEYVHCKNPVLEEAPTRRLVLAVSLEGADWSASSCLALLVCALGTIATPFGENDTTDTRPGSARYTDAQALFQAAQRRMGALMVSTGDEANLVASQCLLLSGLYMMCIFQPFLAWRFFTQALAACQRSAFLQRMYASHEHESATHIPPHNVTASRESQELAIYWSAWKSERELRHCFRLPDFPAAGETGSYLYPPLFPTPPATVSNDLVGEHRQRSSWLFYLAEISLRRLMSRVCREIAALYSSTTAPTFHGSTEDKDTTFLVQLAALVPEYEEQGRQWAASLPAELSLEAPPAYDDVCRFVLRGHYAEYREVLYWPFLAHRLGCYTSVVDHNLQPSSPFLPPPSVTSYHTPPSATTSTPPSWTSTADYLVVQCLEIQVQRLHINKPGFRHRHHGTLFLIRGCMRGLLTLLAANLTGLRMPNGWRDAVALVPDGLLGAWENEMPWLGSWRVFVKDVLESRS